MEKGKTGNRTTAMRIFICIAVVFAFVVSNAKAQDDSDGNPYQDPNQETIDSMLRLITPNIPDSSKATYYSEIAYITNSTDTTLKYALLALNYCHETQKDLKARNNHNIAWALHNITRDKEAVPYLHLAAKYSIETNDSTGLADSYILLGEIYNYLNNNDSSFFFLNKALDISLRINDTTLISDCYNMMGTASFNTNFKKAAEGYLKQAIRLDSLSDNTMGLAYNLKLLGTIYTDYYRQNNNDSCLFIAFKYLNHSITLYDSINSSDPNDIARKHIAYADIAAVYILAAQECNNKAFADSCLKFYWKAESFFAKEGYSDEYFKLLGTYTNYMLFNKEYKQIETYLLNVGKVLKEQTPKSYLKEYHHYLKMVYEKQGNWQKAFEQLSKEYECATAVTSDSAVNVMANSKAQQAVMLEKIQRDKDQKIYETERKSLITMIFSMGLVLVLISVLVFYILRMLNIKRKTNLELYDKNKMLDVQKTELQIHKEIITEQWHEVESVNKKLFSSIRYAQKIQKAALSSETEVNALFPCNFVYYRPRDIVSGDYYKALKCGRFSVMVTADCTGHGIPGAFLSMLGISALKEFMVTEADAENPGTVLDRMRDFIKTTLVSDRRHGLNVDEGMDMTVCCFDFEKLELRYAIANQTAVIIRKGQSIRLKGDNMPVGRYMHEKDHFQSLSQQLEKGDMIYMYSDGIQDQPGGEFRTDFTQKKFLPRQLTATLITMSEKPVEEQSIILDKTILAWRGSTPQVDDMTLVGIRV